VPPPLRAAIAALLQGASAIAAEAKLGGKLRARQAGQQAGWQTDNEELADSGSWKQCGFVCDGQELL